MKAMLIKDLYFSKGISVLYIIALLVCIAFAIIAPDPIVTVFKYALSAILLFSRTIIMGEEHSTKFRFFKNAMPINKKSEINARFIYCILYTVFSFAVTFSVAMVINSVKKSDNVIDLLAVMIVVSAVSICVMTIENRIIYLLFTSAIIGALTNITTVSISTSLIVLAVCCGICALQWVLSLVFTKSKRI